VSASYNICELVSIINVIKEADVFKYISCSSLVDIAKYGYKIAVKYLSKFPVIKFAQCSTDASM